MGVIIVVNYQMYGKVRSFDSNFRLSFARPCQLRQYNPQHQNMCIQVLFIGSLSLLE